MTGPGYPYFNHQLAYLGAGPEGPLAFANSVDAMFVNWDEQRILQKLRSKILRHQAGNREKSLFYEAKQEVVHLDIAVPAHLQDIGTAVGWAGTTVDALDERIEFLGWVTDDGNLNGLDNVYVDNNLGVESNFASVDSLTTGISFAAVSKDEEDPERMLVHVYASSNASVIWDYRKQRAFAGLVQVQDDEGNVIMEILYMLNVTITFAVDPLSGELEIVSRDVHNLNRCFMTRLPNRASARQPEGRSEITPAVRYYTNAAVRTLLGMEVNREFYTAPQRFVLNADPKDFGVTNDMSPEEKYRRGLTLAMGMINIVPGREDNTEGDPVSVLEMKPAPPTPYIEQVKAYAIQMQAETGLPASTFGFVTDNPTSGDAIVKGDFRVARRADRRLKGQAVGWKEVGLLTILGRTGEVDTDFIRRVRCRYMPPIMPTPAATADEIQKMVASKVLVPDSAVTYELYGRLDDRQVAQLEKDKQEYEAKLQREAMREQKLAAANNPQPASDARPKAEPPSDR